MRRTGQLAVGVALIAVLFALVNSAPVASPPPVAKAASPPLRRPPPPKPAALCPNGTSPVQCLVRPCDTPECKAKCQGLGVQCVDNNCGTCSCSCCLKPETICDSKGATKCCGGTMCAIANACAINPQARCGTTCVDPADAAQNCRRELNRCDPKKPQCCQGLRCTKGPHNFFRCDKCPGLNATCSITKQDCCQFLKCKSPGVGITPRCALP